ncbi:hypothetical protein WG906_09760 [Pedobacter sp. P351]|uniref:hypothetical protein n=1 Tax=Pedobacter superstes TaxID=3133441 RepID=UPI00309745CF
MKDPEILKIDSIAVFHSSQVSYSLITKLNEGWVHFLEGVAMGTNEGKFNTSIPPEHLFDTDTLSDSILSIDETIREELQELIQVCAEADCRYFQVVFDDYEIISEEEPQS